MQKCRVYGMLIPEDRAEKYRQILEVLYDYWLSEPEEDKVIIDMRFWKGNEEQEKTFKWQNPKYQYDNPKVPWVRSLSELLEADLEKEKHDWFYANRL